MVKKSKKLIPPLTCICGKICKTTLGFSQHGKWCQLFQKNKLGNKVPGPAPDKSGDKIPEVSDMSKTIDDARRQLRQEIIPLAMSTVMAALSGNHIKEARVRAAVQLIRMCGIDKEPLKNNSTVVVKFGETENELAIEEDVKDDEEDEDDEDKSPVVVDQKVG